MPREEGRRGEGEREHSHIILGFGDGTMLRLLLVGWLWRLLALDGMHELPVDGNMPVPSGRDTAVVTSE